jgi:membrane associated rhomboid family serine protease
MLLPIKMETEIERFPLFTYLLIGANAIIFFSLIVLPAQARELAYYDLGFIPERITWLSMLTSMFVHAGWLHIIGNMYFLWIFGGAVEERLNTLTAAAIYFSGGIAGALLQGWLTPDYLADTPCIGASGAISGILGACAMLYPWEEVSCIYISFTMRYATSISMSSIWVLGSWFIFQFVNVFWFSPKTGDVSVAYWAHIGGFAFGAGIALLIKHLTALSSMLRRRSSNLALEEYSDLLRNGKTEQALERLQKAFASEPSNSLIMGELGRVEITRKNLSRARKLLRRSLKLAIESKDDAKAVSAYLGLMAAGERPPDNARRLVVGRRFVRLKKYGHALGIMGSAFKPASKENELELEGLDKLLYEIGELFAGPLKDSGRATAAYSLLKELFPESPRRLDAEYRLRKLLARGNA